MTASKELVDLEKGTDASKIRHRLEESWFLTILRSIGDGVIAADAGNRVIFMNPVAEHLTGCKVADASTKKLEEVFALKDSGGPAEDPRPALPEEGAKVVNRGVMVSRDGREIPIDFNAETIFNDQGQAAGSILVIRDVTEREKAEEEVRKAYASLETRVEQRTAALRSANIQLIDEIKHRHLAEDKLQEINQQLKKACDAKDNFLARMSHELRTPLNAIIGFTGTLLMRLPGPLTRDQERQLNNISVSAKHLLSLINDLLDLSKIESGEIEIKRELFSCGEFVKKIASTMALMAENKGLALKISVPNPDLPICTDRRILSQILINLIDNAIKNTENGEINIIVKSNGDEALELSVVDTGIGIKPGDLDKLFQAFTRVGPPRSDGAGLGLYLSNMLAESIGGQIAVSSELGKGSEFTLILKGISEQ